MSEKHLPSSISITGWVKPKQGIVDQQFISEVRSIITETDADDNTYEANLFAVIEITSDQSAFKFRQEISPLPTNHSSFVNYYLRIENTTFLYLVMDDFYHISESFDNEKWYDISVEYPSYVIYEGLRYDNTSTWVNGVMMAAVLFDNSNLDKYFQPYSERADGKLDSVPMRLTRIKELNNPKIFAEKYRMKVKGPNAEDLRFTSHDFLQGFNTVLLTKGIKFNEVVESVTDSNGIQYNVFF